MSEMTSLEMAQDVAQQAPRILDELQDRIDRVDSYGPIGKLAARRVLAEVINRLDILKQIGMIATTEIYLHCLEDRDRWLATRDQLERSIHRAHLLMHTCEEKVQ